MKPKPIDWSVRWLAEKINKTRPRKGSKQWPTTKTWPSIEIPLPTRRNTLHTHTHSDARARTNWASRRRSVTTHNNTWSCSSGKMATHSLTKNVRKSAKRNKQTIEKYFDEKLAIMYRRTTERQASSVTTNRLLTHKNWPTQRRPRDSHTRALHYAPSAGASATTVAPLTAAKSEKNTRRRI